MSEQIITFDNLVQSTGVIGKYKTIKAKIPESLISRNEPMNSVSVASLQGISDLANASAKKLLKVFSL